MSQDNNVICYEGIQRIFRNAIVGFLRSSLCRAYPQNFEEKLRAPFQKEWETIRQNALAARQSGELTVPLADDFDLIGVNHFFNLFDVYYDVFFSNERIDNMSERKRQKQTLLSWVKTIKNLRDPLSHPAETDFNREDSFMLLDEARRILNRLNLEEDEHKIKILMDKLIGISKIIESAREPLEARLPPRESIVVDFIGRDKELKQLRDWFLDPASRIWALAGDGGKGKSALAYNFALEVRLNAHEPFEAVFWLSAKRRRFLEGTIITIDEPDFHDLDSVLSRLLIYYGWVDEIEQFIEKKKHRVLELLSELPAFIVVDDIDSLESENEDVSEFFSFHLSRTKSKVLFTSRRTLFGLGGHTTHIGGFMEQEAEKFILSRCHLMDLDLALFNKEVIQRIIKVTEGSPLYIEDLMRLTAAVYSSNEAIRQWEERVGNEARRYALGRECELLSPNARKVLFAGCICPGQVSFAEIEAVTGLSSDVITAALQELQRLFLVPKPRLIEGDQRFEINFNTRALVREVYGSSDQYRRLEDAYRTRSEGVSKIGRGNVRAIIRQAIFLLKTGKHLEAEQLLQNALLEYPNDPDLIGVLGLVYKAWSPPRVTDAREKFVRAWQLKSSSQDMYEHWYKLEAREQEWTKAAGAAENGLKVLPNNRILLYFAGYARGRLAKELLGGLHREKAKRELSEARKLLEKALKISDDLDARAKTMNTDIYRALVLIYEYSGDVRRMRHYFKLWQSENPDDPDMASEWERVAEKYQL